ncbi:hypothetical protein ebA7264 [Aromatoleum aromaticum EbN1]|uniref:Uncharacterized protein n=1 Tax=Aromatoleum aromaticum (strain DSM 19018 / LMG 30748 / EbN1) TaxID=76114 RepID=Q5NXH5_AROAE|nr:hypothetical protein [Aromatoleum aromaticum]CAI10239.1 hypothetical protein ebA7264 [Aromatoleum aromaticum EbN1]
MQVLHTLKLILSLLPLILEAVRAIEAALPEGGQGAAKLALLRQTIEAAASTVTGGIGAFEQLWPAIERTVAAVVTLYNSTGAFKTAP